MIIVMFLLRSGFSRQYEQKPLRELIHSLLIYMMITTVLGIQHRKLDPGNHIEMTKVVFSFSFRCYFLINWQQNAFLLTMAANNVIGRCYFNALGVNFWLSVHKKFNYMLQKWTVNIPWILCVWGQPRHNSHIIENWTKDCSVYGILKSLGQP